MTDASEDAVVISVGGSLIVPDAIDTAFLEHFRDLIRSFVDGGKRFFIVAGGGKTCRRYQSALSDITDASDADLDWMGIYTTRLNAQLVRKMFGDLAHDEILDPSEVTRSTKPITISAGLKPGCSTDYRAVQVADTIQAPTLINLSNIDYVYNKDPNRHDDAEKIIETTWAEFRDLLPDEWDPGINTPFDPVAAKEAQELGLELALLNGENPDNIRRYINGEEYIGTVVHAA